MATLKWEQRLVVGPIQANCWVLRCPKTGEMAVIDPGDDTDEILGVIRSDRAGAKVRFLLLTHGHFDHIGGVRALRDELTVAGHEPQIAIHRADEPLYSRARQQAEYFGLSCADPAPVDRWLEDEEALEVGELKLQVLHTPGHSPGGVCYRLQGDAALGISETVYSGDTLFKESIGRSDLMGGDHRALLLSIRARLLVLDDGVRVCPGHGPGSTIGHEKRANRLLRD